MDALLTILLIVFLFLSLKLENCSVCSRRYRLKSKYLPIENCCSLECYGNSKEAQTHDTQ